MLLFTFFLYYIVTLNISRTSLERCTGTKYFFEKIWMLKKYHFAPAYFVSSKPFLIYLVTHCTFFPVSFIDKVHIFLFHHADLLLKLFICHTVGCTGTNFSFSTSFQDFTVKVVELKRNLWLSAVRRKGLIMSCYEDESFALKSALFFCIWRRSESAKIVISQ